jgi:hypothetical protein
LAVTHSTQAWVFGSQTDAFSEVHVALLVHASLHIPEGLQA